MIGAPTLPVSHAATIVFFPEGAYGPTNNCVGIGQVLRSRGIRVVFIIEESFGGGLEARGFEERLMRLGPPPETEEAPGQFWKDFIAATAPEFRKPTIAQLETFIAPTMGALVDGARFVDDRLREIIDELQPDLVVEDNVCTFPALLTHAKRWARIVSCNPAELVDIVRGSLFETLDHLRREARYDTVIKNRRNSGRLPAADIVPFALLAGDVGRVERVRPPLLGLRPGRSGAALEMVANLRGPCL